VNDTVSRLGKILLLNTVAAVVTIAALVGARTWWGRPAATENAPLAVLGEVPDFSLQERNGGTVGLADLKDHVWVANFVFTHCAGPCPLLTSRMAVLEKRLGELPDVRLVSFTVDPERDTPEVLRDYAKSYGAGERWFFLTGEKPALYELIMDGFKLGIDDGSAVTAGAPGPGTITHSVRFVLVDRHGRIRGYYDGTEPGLPDKLLPLVRALRGE
jgi:cytochrome oxidase Cu insertion factor (SCO1/SenC/PrrC family)